MGLFSEPCRGLAACRIAIRIFERIVMAVDFTAGFVVYAWEQKSYEMNKCLSLVHLTSTIGSE